MNYTINTSFSFRKSGIVLRGEIYRFAPPAPGRWAHSPERRTHSVVGQTGAFSRTFAMVPRSISSLMGFSSSAAADEVSDRRRVSLSDRPVIKIRCRGVRSRIFITEWRRSRKPSRAPAWRTADTYWIGSTRVSATGRQNYADEPPFRQLIGPRNGYLPPTLPSPGLCPRPASGNAADQLQRDCLRNGSVWLGA